ncbi:Fluoroquinolones export ATP-binding protein Rv2688c/MT2762 [Porphyromonas macacae]|uniref:Fluoroquinolones export ATP-binding protein Rv2688c/MT2762 n=1 Tax=Porphyromonas macacae TaxID=28115 RepID=A0A379DI91_9PORP|nr:ABC transporter ATP-binding protein [Porphyromonas macacae]SUB77445.1 Fluoroquinolones export ATP-binding protein Rv2688c/MT2762 [Porphyromonas macacae]
MDKVIECRNITHYYGQKPVYEGLSFEVERGKVLGLLGKNGTGKTTIINILNGFLKPRSGECFLLGEDSKSISPRTKAKIGLLLEGHVQYSFFNIMQIEKFYRDFYPRWNADAYFELMAKLKVEPKQPIAKMSCGQRSQVALGLLFAQDPELLILDDFSMGLDPGYRRLFVEYLRDWAHAGNKTIFLTSHIIQDMEYLIDDCMIMDYGRLMLHKPTAEILENFRRFHVTLPASVNRLNFMELLSVERKENRWTFYSFLKETDVTQLLSANGIYPESTLTVEKLSLEDAFIGLTGKY